MAQPQSEMNIFPLSDTWTLWFHNVDDTNWSEESYKKVCEIRTLRDFWIVFNQIETVMAGMFFLMKNDIFPRWEDINNINGGYLAFRISKKDTDKSWVNLAQAMVGNTLTRQPEKMDLINGISISPKINSTILAAPTKKSPGSTARALTETASGGRGGSPSSCIVDFAETSPNSPFRGPVVFSTNVCRWFRPSNPRCALALVTP